jgi:hypothetical protein
MSRNLSADRAFVRDRAKAIHELLRSAVLLDAAKTLHAAAGMPLSGNMVGATERALRTFNTRLTDILRVNEMIGAALTDLRVAVDEEVAEARAGGP